MKIVTKIFEGIADIQMFPIIGLFIFLTVFIVLIIQVSRMSRQQVDEYSHLPLDNDNHQSYDHEIQKH
ncbi:MAG TPA: cbb3-type cytochrome c oxidase subunit 3 [Bacteroidales bacterium]|nr:cbb3-type cytochrome c oxidase subunit 3 [Bacteroidales bacterium]